MRILGHADVKSTLVYARLKRETLKDVMKFLMSNDQK